MLFAFFIVRIKYLNRLKKGSYGVREGTALTSSQSLLLQLSFVLLDLVTVVIRLRKLKPMYQKYY